MTTDLAPADMLAAQARAKLFALLALLALLGAAVWFLVGRVPLDARSVLVAVAVGDEEDPAAYWWGGDPGSAALHGEFSRRLEPMGLNPLVDEEHPVEFWLPEFAGAAAGDLLERARNLGIGTIVSGSVQLEAVHPLEGTRYSDLVLMLELRVTDVETGEVFPVPSSPVRLYLWGVDASRALDRNAAHVAERMTMPLASVLSELPELARYGELPDNASNLARLLATQLRPLHLRAHNYRAGLELREADLASAEARDPNLPGRRLGGVLDAEFFLGEDVQGLPLVLREQLHLTVPTTHVGYALPATSEAIERVGSEREFLFERYNLFSTARSSADGTQVACVVDNHGISRTLGLVDTASGAFAALLTSETEYFSNPLPSPDARRIAFFSRATRDAPLALELFDRDKAERRTLVAPGPVLSVPSWSRDGRTLYLALGEEKIGRIESIDLESGSRRVLLGVDPAAPAGVDASKEADAAPPPLPGADSASLTPQAQAQLEAQRLVFAATHAAFAHPTVDSAGNLFVAEQGEDGHFIGHLDVQSGAYRRLVRARVARLRANPTRPLVAAKRLDPATGDDPEVELFNLDGASTRLTDNEGPEEVVGWSRDGGALYLQESLPQPHSNRRASRVYRITVDPATD